MYLRKCLITVLLALCLAGISDAIRCYDCQSTVDFHHCGEEFKDGNQVKQVDCNTKPKPPGFEFAPTPTKCSKSVVEDTRGKVVLRGCHFEMLPGTTQCTMEANHARPKQCESCTGDLCNGAPKSIAIGTALLVITSAIFML